ncbi:MAG: PhzF family phenazine biosynthesis protein [Cyanobium sp.]|nr:PhzF family phenazine biosynthesis protein [Cyanobium sp.]
MTDPSILAFPAVLVEAFTATACGGNGAAVVWLDRPLGDAILQGIARSLNQSETAFLLHHHDRWLLRWFTPSCEVPLCGHATLAAALALGHWRQLGVGHPAALHSRSGPLEVQLAAVCATGQPGQASIVLPGGGLQAAAISDELKHHLRRCLGADPQGYWHSALGYRVVLLDPQAPLAGADLAVEDLPPSEASGLVLMQPLGASAALQVLGEPCRYQLRFLAPGLGIPEDPVTGSAHALVAPWWMARLGVGELGGWQCSHRPGGMVSRVLSSGMIRLDGAGHLLWDGTLQVGSSAACDLGASIWASLSP